uniref:Uncharacterized protein n=1 Tax=Branchiostoma floridae TaxID=7739 RepID=C3XQ41_BRAFL|eukprot:XP_002614053.1 hypothetical protein BRAFLDRAFT_67362 [Branchiostoma floridae]
MYPKVRFIILQTMEGETENYNRFTEHPDDVKMATTDPSPMAEPLQDKKTRNQGKVGPQENGEMFDQKTTRNGNLKGAIVGTKERLVAVLTTGGKENGNIDVDMNYNRFTEHPDDVKMATTDPSPVAEPLQDKKTRNQGKVGPQENGEMFDQKTTRNGNLKGAIVGTKERLVAVLTTGGKENGNIDVDMELNEKLQLELRDKQHEVMETTKAKEAIETSSQEKIRQLKEQLRSSASVVHQEKAAKEKAWADAVTWRAATERLVEQHSSMEETAREELLHLTERLKELEILCRTVHPLLPGVDDLTECQCHLPDLTGDDILLTSHMRECQSCQRVVTPYLFHIKTCHKINCERCAHVRRLYCGHVFTCDKEECDVTGCVETREDIRGSQLSPEDLQNDKQFKDKISARLRKSTSPTECGGIFRAFQQAEYWAVAVGPVNLHRHQVNNRLLQIGVEPKEVCWVQEDASLSCH